MFKMYKSERAITLIALVVTIIVLIILAGVSINLVLGDNGIITKAKEAKQNTEFAKIEEEKQLNETVEYLEEMKIIKTVEQMRTAGIYMTEKTTLKDSNGNFIVVPEGFKISKDSGINVTEGIVIEDKDIIKGIENGKGNQYVWIPVGEKIKKQNEDGTISEVDVLLGRYVFSDGVNYKDNEGTVIPKGTPILKQSAENYEDETGINVKEVTPTATSNQQFKELKLSREGIVGGETDGLNTTALNLKGFIDSVKENGGYYIARYESSYGADGKANSKISTGIQSSRDKAKEEGMLWNFITQISAATASRGLYENVATDLINSYAWDTAIIYIQEFSKIKDYSRQNGQSLSNGLRNTGENNDEICKINDMGSNMYEWTTESSNNNVGRETGACIFRGTSCYEDYTHTSFRDDSNTTDIFLHVTFRMTLYM